MRGEIVSICSLDSLSECEQSQVHRHTMNRVAGVEGTHEAGLLQASPLRHSVSTIAQYGPRRVGHIDPRCDRLGDKSAGVIKLMANAVRFPAMLAIARIRLTPDSKITAPLIAMKNR